MRLQRLALFAALLAVLSGCRQSSSAIHGKVTYEGAAVQRGQITFAPPGRQGVALSGTIEAGKYKIDNVPPGQKLVMITSVKQFHFPKSHAEMAEMAKRGPPPAQDTADEVPANAEGNNQSIEVTQGVRELNFDLKRPKGG